MGRATKWFRHILGLKKPDPTQSQPTSKAKSRWSFVKRNSLSERETRAVDDDSTPPAEFEDANKHAIAMAAATAAVAEAAVAAAHAAAAVVRLTSNSGRSGSNFPAANVGGGGGTRDELALAAIKIQSAFRAYLARRALRALRGLVRLQALVRGHIERKRTAEWLQRMQALLRTQAQAHPRRAQISDPSQSSGKSSHFHHLGPATPEKFEHSIRSKNSKCEVSLELKKRGSKSNDSVNGDHVKTHVSWNRRDHQMDNRKDQKGHSTRISNTDDEKSDKIIEIDSGKSNFTPKHRNLFHSPHLTVSSEPYSHHIFTTSKDSTAHQTESLIPLKSSHEVEDFCTANNSPQFYSASSRGGSSKRSPFTPMKTNSSQSCLSCYSDHPNYMAYTESSRAKVRSFSAPKQRPQQYGRSSSTTRYSIHQTFGKSKSSAQRFTAWQPNFTNKF